MHDELKLEAEQFAHHFMAADGEQVVRDMAGYLGEQLFETLKRNGMLMRSVAGSVGILTLAAAQTLAQAHDFLRRSMADTSGGGAAIMIGDAEASAIALLFVGELPDDLKAAFTLPPANTEADVERAFRAGHAAGFDCADNTSRAEVNHVEDAWDEYRAALSGGEEVRDPAYDYAVSLLRVLHGKHFPEQAALKMLPDTLGVLTQIDNLTSALTKPPALPKEGEELLQQARSLRDFVFDNTAGETREGMRLRELSADHVARLALSSLPVRSGEAEKCCEHQIVAGLPSGPCSACGDRG